MSVRGKVCFGRRNMPDALSKSPLEHAVELMVRHGVEFIIIGGQAEVLFGGSRVTFDIDFCYRRTTDNLDRLAAALREIKPRLRGAPPDLPFLIDARALALGSNFTLETSFGPFDLLGDLEPLGGYDELMRNVERYELGNHQINVIGLDDLIRIKQHIKRPRDQDSLLQLLAIKRVRAERGELQ